MAKVFRVNSSTGKCAIFSTTAVPRAADPVPAQLTNPSANESDIHFHSDWLYPNVIGADRAGVVNIPAIPSNAMQNLLVNLFAHGQAAPPMVFGHIVVNGNNIALPCMLSRNTYSPTFISLKVDATNVYLASYGIGRAGVGATAVNVSYVVRVTNCLTTGPVPAGSPSLPAFRWYAAENYLQMGNGKIDSRLRYIKKASSGGFPIVRGDTLQIVRSATNNNYIDSGQYLTAGYSFNGYKVDIYGTATINPTFTMATC